MLIWGVGVVEIVFRPTSGDAQIQRCATTTNGRNPQLLPTVSLEASSQLLQEVPFVQMALQTEKIIFELIMNFIADTDTDKYYLGINFRSRCRHSCSLQF